MTLQRTLRDLLRHFLTGSELSRDELHRLIDRAIALKVAPYASDVLDRRSVALIFQKPSTRTRVSFESGIPELGGHPMVLRTEELQLTRGESVRDTAYVLSRHAAAIGIRTGPDELVEELASYATVPVVNMLTAHHHPCQALADLMTLQETFGRLDGLTLAYIGDGNNVARSLAILGELAGVEVRVASPLGYRLEPVAGAILTDDPHEAAAGANALYTAMTGRPRHLGATRSGGTGSTMRCLTVPLRTPWRCTACRRIPARRSRPRCSTATGRRSGIRRRTADTHRRRCSSFSSPGTGAEG
jgi:ornithine carbamoyltransferase